MALSGLDIFKKLPKTNCKKCNLPTCLAFAMQVAAGKMEISLCPDVSDDVVAQIAEATAPPIRPVTIGTGDDALKIGEETVMFRHDKRFEHQPCIGLLLTDEMSDDILSKHIEQFKVTGFERVGIMMKAEVMAIKSVTGDAERFKVIVKRVMDETQALLVLMSDSSIVLEAGLSLCRDRKPLLCGVNTDNLAQVAQLAKENNCPVVAKGKDLDELADLTNKLTASGVKDIVLYPIGTVLKDRFEQETMMRRLALKKIFRPLGFPTINFPCDFTSDKNEEMMIAATFVAKYSGIIILSTLEPHYTYPLFCLRMNIYTDPQRPMTMEEKVYEFNNPDKDSPVLITTNFSLTYFLVAGEIESSRKPVWLAIQNTEGLSVLTAWSAGKFNAESIAKFIKSSGITEKVSHRNLIIPGYVAELSGDLEEEMGAGWKVIVGPREAPSLPGFLKQMQV
ncbi:acetyl-CoA decarbonylase/synthase complex subunit gamma [Candidatus Desantisbacteria bacterium CG_4_8_14_3_um_filter_40_12]|uniref:Acetyl-CoA decarbonylase/synthase complex subunit gamma n=1 Tax=Candidatus Desantisbacteria bacterium CG_4_8_14_3_um_filter_40_12 TaxID=1974545 RepID=A0A2M7J9F7_9BACT|nr:MAG: acetyl-CoA decarbonylase/synthase complex subunit gamma [Candidatus Desantisbacteria bacterium CG_4_8_14_3_um_filter_40_12]